MQNWTPIAYILFQNLGGTLTVVRTQNQWCRNSVSSVLMTIGGPLHRYCNAWNSHICKLYLFVKNLEFDSPPESVWLTSRVCTCLGSWWELLGLAFSPISEPPTLLYQISSHRPHHHQHYQHRPLDQVWSEDDLPGRLPGHHHLRLLHLPLLIHAGVGCWLCW